MQQKLLNYLELLSLILFGFSLAYLISAALSLKYPDISHFQTINVNCPVHSYRADFMVAKEGFFKPTTTATGTSVPVMEETFSLGEYTLKGTVVCSQCGHSIAILEKSGKTVILSVGSKLHGYKLVRVYPDRVIFSKGSREVILVLKTLKKVKVNSSTPSTSAQTNTFTVKRSEIIKQISSGDFLRYINIVPVKNPAGLKVNYVSPRSFIYKLGIRPGDVILSINDIRIKTPEDSFSAFEQLKSADSITLVVLRNGKEVKLHYELE